MTFGYLTCLGIVMIAVILIIIVLVTLMGFSIIIGIIVCQKKRYAYIIVSLLF